ncbi:cytochrome c biogenesis protein CcsA [Neisseria leonii]|uniref:Cytochrome c biogenesis protein CcsA n=1 Tax=Neisseria leonii TaxID=2995413 RepID=A0A9X4IB45_9NEIS|nr:cytochrome c biogenesis protein CcsA [Neisseria sp. 51.81]MDD9328029.1 cytochrome c biogenesis protein CcsA [Neisseria sp. 51.81]
MQQILLVLALAYAALGAWAWLGRRRADKPYSVRGEQSVLAPLLLLHGALVLLPPFGARELVMGFGYALCLVWWLMLMLYFGGSFFYRLNGLQLLLYPLAAASLAAAAYFPGRHAAYQLANLPFMLHLISALLAYSLFAVSALLAVLVLWLHRNLRRRRHLQQVYWLPPLLSLEKMMLQGVWAGFILLTLAVVSGTVFAEEVFRRPLQWNHKTVFGIMSWLIYALLLLRRRMTAWRGKRVAVWTIIGFVSLMTAYIGSKFVLEILLPAA